MLIHVFLKCMYKFIIPFLYESLSSLGLVADMDSGAAPSLFPLHRCKTIHLVCFKSDFQFGYSVYFGSKRSIYLV